MIKLSTASKRHVQLDPADFPIKVETSVKTDFGSMIKVYELQRNPKGSIRLMLLTKTLDKKKSNE